MTITILNIPNHCSSYYLLGLSQEYKIRYNYDQRFAIFNNFPLIIFQVNDKIGVIDNRDPSGIPEELYALSDLYFTTNKHKNIVCYNQSKVEPLFPHYPVNILPLYIGLFKLNLIRFFKWKELVSELYTQFRRPYYKKMDVSKNSDNFIFFSSNIWKRELVTNEIRAQFIRFCKNDSRVIFEGGFVPRSDGDNMGFDNEINKVKYTPKEFTKLSAKSKIVLNNPAVCDAVSWRLAECLNQGLFVLSFPFKIHLPKDFCHAQDIHFITATTEYKSVLDKVFVEPMYHEKIALNGKKYFDEFCTPKAQAKYIIELLIDL
jgi:hypothetical protein